eukprot:3824873-Rhodomonas_salina.1
MSRTRYSTHTGVMLYPSTSLMAPSLSDVEMTETRDHQRVRETRRPRNSYPGYPGYPGTPGMHPNPRPGYGRTRIPWPFLINPPWAKSSRLFFGGGASQNRGNETNSGRTWAYLVFSILLSSGYPGNEPKRPRAVMGRRLKGKDSA